MAKELYLVDDFNKVYKSIQRPAAAVAKTRNTIKMSKTLHDQSLHDDDKVRHYVSLLHRLLNIRDSSTTGLQQRQTRRPRRLISKSASPRPRHRSSYDSEDDDYYADGEDVKVLRTSPPVGSKSKTKTEKNRKQRRSTDWPASYK